MHHSRLLDVRSLAGVERLDLADHLLFCGLDLRCVLARMVCVRTYPVLIPRSFYGYLRFNLSEQ